MTDLLNLPCSLKNCSNSRRPTNTPDFYSMFVGVLDLQPSTFSWTEATSNQNPPLNCWSYQLRAELACIISLSSSSTTLTCTSTCTFCMLAVWSSWVCINIEWWFNFFLVLEYILDPLRIIFPPSKLFVVIACVLIYTCDDWLNTICERVERLARVVEDER